jgi:peptide/nickel transport system substrate-binding protein
MRELMRHSLLLWPLRFGGVLVLLVCLLAACAPAASQPQVNGSGPERARTTPKRLVTAIMAEPPALHRSLIPPGYIIQTGDVVDTILNMGLTTVDHQGGRRPVLAETVPTVENGLWKVLPDGTMEITWKIQPNAVWHDGTPFTADDLAFTATIFQDRDLPEFRASSVFDVIERVEAVDAKTLRTVWKRPFIRADNLFATGADTVAAPLPKHMLERTYLENKDAFRQASYWTTDYVGAGPFKLREWVQGSHLLLDANDHYVLGRPKIDELEIRFILDANAVIANVLSGTVQATIGTGLNLEQSVEIRDQWRDGRLDVSFDSWIFAAPQFINPTPAIVTDVRFRRALLHAIDRQAMADTIQAGLVPIAHNYVRPDEPEYAPTEPYVVKYEYDPRRAMQGLEELGYIRGSDGMLVDQSGQRLSMEVRATASPAIHAKSLFPVVDYWQRAGVTIEPVVIPVQRLTDVEYRTTHPSFEVVRYRSGAGRVEQLHGSAAPLPTNRFTGTNRSRYINPEFDGLIDTYLATIPWEPRMQALGQVVRHISERLNVLGLFYDVRPTLVGNRLQNAYVQNPTWNLHEWDLAS